MDHSSWFLRVLNPNTWTIEKYPLFVNACNGFQDLILTPIPNADALHIAIEDINGKVVFRYDILTKGDFSSTLVKFQLTNTQEVVVSHPHNMIETLPEDRQFDPIPVIPPSQPFTQFDIAIIIDGTMREIYHTASSSPHESLALLLNQKEAWKVLSNKLLNFLNMLGADEYARRFEVIAFGDQKSGFVDSNDLNPSYCLFPYESDQIEKYTLRLLGIHDLQQKLLAVKSTTGSDFVDALADAMNVANYLNWRPGARKIIIIIGDSPGYSILDPAHIWADVCVRDQDIDTHLLRCARQGIEILTLYHDALKQSGRSFFAEQAQLLDFAQNQYLRIASLREMAFLTSDFSPEHAAHIVLNREVPIARHSAFGVLGEMRWKVPDFVPTGVAENKGQPLITEEAMAVLAEKPIIKASLPDDAVDQPVKQPQQKKRAAVEPPPVPLSAKPKCIIAVTEQAIAAIASMMALIVTADINRKKYDTLYENYVQSYFFDLVLMEGSHEKDLAADLFRSYVTRLKIFAFINNAADIKRCQNAYLDNIYDWVQAESIQKDLLWLMLNDLTSFGNIRKRRIQMTETIRNHILS